MPFPSANRIIYTNNPLVNVVCQLRFPSILRIDTEPPAGFQDAVREKFPEYEEKDQYSHELAIRADGPLDLSSPEQFAKSTKSKNHHFESEDGKSRINLMRNFVSVSTSSYERWETFRSCVESAKVSLENEYNPSFYTRIGLRYVDVFDRQKLGVEDVEWSDLINQKVLGLLANDLGLTAAAYESSTEILLDEGGPKVRLIARLVKNTTTGGIGLMIDSDFYINDRTPKEDALGKIDYLHEYTTNLIQWIIQPRLQEALKPINI